MSKLPDILDCLANLSSDEVFTSPELANKMLDDLPSRLWSDPTATFLDPATKSGVFLREIASRLNVGLKNVIPDQQERINHILKNQIFGISTSILTAFVARRSVYCSKDANHDNSYGKNVFNDPQGNIVYYRTDHDWKNGKCVTCGMTESVYNTTIEGEVAEKEVYAYPFIHNNSKLDRILDMKFNVIISNPPYQMATAGTDNKAQAKPLYNVFIEKAISMNPEFISMIVPARWQVGGMGLSTFRDTMLSDVRVKKMTTYEDASDCFPENSIEGGITHFLWHRNHSTECETVFVEKGNLPQQPVQRYLKDVEMDTFIANTNAVAIKNKVDATNTFKTLVRPINAFGFETKFRGESTRNSVEMVKIYTTGKKEQFVNVDSVMNGAGHINKWKVFIAEANGSSDNVLGKPFIGAPGEIATATYLLIGSFDTKEECESVISYINTKFFRFMVSLLKLTQHGTSKVYNLVPMQDFNHTFTDEELYKTYKLTNDEIKIIEDRVKAW